MNVGVRSRPCMPFSAHLFHSLYDGAGAGAGCEGKPSCSRLI